MIAANVQIYRELRTLPVLHFHHSVLAAPPRWEKTQVIHFLFILIIEATKPGINFNILDINQRAWWVHVKDKVKVLLLLISSINLNIIYIFKSSIC